MRKSFLYIFFLFGIFCATKLYSQAPPWVWSRNGSSASAEYINKVVYDPFTDSIVVTGLYSGNIAGLGLVAIGGGGDVFFLKYHKGTGTLGLSKSFGSGTGADEGYAVATDATNGDIYIAGRFNGTCDFDPGAGVYNLVSTAQDAFLAKYNRGGTFQWCAKIGGASTDAAVGVKADANGVYVTGSFIGATTFSSSNATTIVKTAMGGSDIFCAKYNAAGVVQWVANSGSTVNDAGYNITADANRIYLIGDYNGTFTVTNSASVTVGNLTSQGATGDIAIIAYNQNGTYAWHNNISTTTADRGRGITVDANNVYVTGGVGTGTVGFKYPAPTFTRSTNATLGLFVAGLNNASGLFQWGRAETSALGTATAVGNAIDIHASGKLFVGGAFNNTLILAGTPNTSLSTIGGSDVFVASYLVNGQLYYGTRGGTSAGTSSSDDYGNGIAVDLVSDAYLGGIHAGAAVFPPLAALPTAALSNIFLAKVGCGGVLSYPTAGADQTVCATTATFAANTPTNGTGTWSLQSGGGTITSPTTPTSGITALAVGTNTFVWTITGSGCAPLSDTVKIIRQNFPTVSNAGTTMSLCGTTTLLAGNVPVVGTGTWSTFAGTSTITNVNLATSAVTVGAGAPFSTTNFSWTIGNGICPVSTSTVSIISYTTSSPSNAGTTMSICGTSTTMAGNVPAAGTGTWSTFAGTSTLTNVNLATSNVTVGAGSPFSTTNFSWTIKNGVCPSTTSTVSIISYTNSPPSNAGVTMSVCGTPTALAGNVPAVGTGTWSTFAGTSTITNVNLATSNVTVGPGSPFSTTSFSWTIKNGVCPSTTSTVSIISHTLPSTSVAGANQTVCAATATMNGNTPAVGTGTWSLVSGAGNITSPNSPTTGLTALGFGINVFQWTIGNGICATSISTMSIQRDTPPTVSNAGPNQTVCATTATLAGNAPAIGTGVWNVVTGPGLVSAPSLSNSGVISLGLGSNVFQWVISNGVCPSSSSTVQIFVDTNPTASNAGPSQSVCAVTNATMAGNIPAVGTGSWTLVSGSALITTPTSPTTGITALGIGVNVFMWSISNGVCPTSTSTMSITRYPNPTASIAGPNQTVCATVATMAGNTPAIGTGSWTLISGSGNITTPTLETTGITALGVGVNVFQWSITSGVCPVSSSTMSIQRDNNPTPSVAGSNQSVCATTATMTGNVPAVGTGSWSLVSGAANITTPTLATSGITALGVGVNVFMWTISNGVCPSSSSTMSIQRDANPTAAIAGPNQTVCVSTGTHAANTPAIGNGVWTLIAGSGVVTTPTSPTSGITGMALGSNVFQWTISNGVCPASSATVEIYRDNNPTLSNAGPNQTVCATTATLAGNIPAVGTGSWTLVSGVATIVSPTSPSSQLTGLGVGINILQWTVINGSCPPSSSTVSIQRDNNPTASNAGSNYTLCSTSNTTMAGNVPAVGTGSWTLVSGVGTITTPTLATTGITALGTGTNIFQWTISNGVCASSSSTMAIINFGNPTAANAGVNQTVCATVATMAGNNPAVGTGSWTLISGSAVITSPTSFNTGITAIAVGVNIFQWTISNGTCPPSTSTMSIQRDAIPTPANAGSNQVVCSTTVTMAGNVPAIGTGSWTLISGAGTITTPTLPTTGITALGVGINIFQWTISNGVCASSSATVSIQRDASPTVSNAGPTQSLCITTTSTNLAANIPAIGVGVWNVVSGPGLIVTPTSPNTQVLSLGLGLNEFEWSITNGVCPASTSTVSVYLHQTPTIANAGATQSVCGITTATLAGNVPAVGTGSWTIILGSGSITSPTSPTSGLTALGVGTNVLQWTISNGVCPASTSTVAIIRYLPPSVSNAGTNQTVCATIATMAGNVPAIGTGSWTLISGGGTITTPTLATTGLTALAGGINIFQWTISNGNCAVSTSTVSIQRDLNPTASLAGPNQTVCAATATLAGNTPAVGTGTWSLIFGAGNITSLNSPNSGITALGFGVNIFQWTIGNGVCANSISTVSIQNDQNPSVSVAGPNQTVCVTSATMAANTPAVGTGSWTLISGGVTITTPTLSSTGLTALAIGTNIFQWTISNGVCSSSSSTMSIQRDPSPTVANAGPNQTVCVLTATMAGNLPAVGTGSWTLVSGSGVITSPTSPNTGITGLGFGVNVFQWTISNGICPNSTATMSIQNDQPPSISVAGTNQTLCASPTTNMTGNVPAIGIGLWTLVSGGGSITSPTVAATAITALGTGTNIFQWTISNGVCPASSSTMSVINYGSPTPANAGSNQTVCATIANLAGNVPAVGTGSWTLISGIAVITSPTSANSGVTGLGGGVNIFQWTISNGICPPSSSTVSIQRDLNPTTATVSANQVTCSTTATLTGITPTVGTGLWTLVSGGAVISSPASATTGVTALAVGVNVFQWTISNGVCPSSSATLSVQRDANPTVSNAGPTQSLCGVPSSFSTNLAANNPVVGVGSWNVVTGPGLIITPTSPNTQVILLGNGLNQFEWSITNGVCPASTSTVSVYVDQLPSVSNAGPSQSICATVATMAGNSPAVGTGTWNLVSGSGVITSPNLFNTGLTALGVGTNVFQWTIGNGVCPNSSSTVSITRYLPPSVSVAGPSQSVCATSATMAANVPAIGTGSWTLISGAGTIANTTLATTPLSALGTSTSVPNIFMWTISNGPCAVSTSTVLIDADAPPTSATAGPNQTICISTATLAGNIPAIGTGSWTLISGGAVITTPTLSSTGLTSVAVGTNILQWTITNGVCPPSISTVAIVRDPNPTPAVAGPNQTICAGAATLAGNTPVIGTGLWTLISGGATITTPTLPTTGVTAVSIATSNILQWTISNGVCPSSSSTMSIQRDALPTVSSAGPNQTICATATVLAGNTPVIGTGLWTLISGGATITTPTLPTTGVTAVSIATSNILQWTISNGVCPSSSSTMSIQRDALPTVSNAGPNQTICATATVLAGNTPVIGTGLWTLISGGATITTPTLPTTGVTAVSIATSNILQWTISNGVCPSSSSTMSIQRDALPTVSSAGPNQTVCSTAATLAGNVPIIGTGLWNLVSGGGTITTPTLQNSGLTSLTVGVNVFQWTISNGVCPSSSSTVSIQRDDNPTVSNAGPSQSVCSTNATMAGNIPSVGTGTWTLVSGVGTIVSPNANNSAITGLGLGTNVFQWTIGNGVCPNSSSTVAITSFTNPTVANAGPNQTICATATVLAANTATIGSGVWAVLVGPGVVTLPSSPNSGVTGLAVGINVFQWSITNGVCPVSVSTVTIQVDANPSISNAGPNQTVCVNYANLNATPPAIGTGSWTLLVGAGTIVSPSSATSSLTGIPIGTDILQWTTSNGVCPSSSSTVSIMSIANVGPVNAGADLFFCGYTPTLNAATPAVGSGTWVPLGSGPNVASPNNPTTSVTFTSANTYTYVWFVGFLTCPNLSDTLQVTLYDMPTPASVSGDQTVCISSANTTISANTPTIGTGIWNVITGPGSVTTPSNSISPVTGLTAGMNSFQWVISNGTCPPSTATTNILVDAAPSTPVAGPDQTICVNSTTSLNATNPPIGVGVWNVLAGGGAVTTPTFNNSAVTTLTVGINTFGWTVTNGVCPPQTDNVNIFVDDLPSIALAGADQFTCSLSTFMSGNIPAIGNGTWIPMGAAPNVNSPTSFSSAVSFTNQGIYSYVWTVGNGVCPTSTDVVNINTFLNPSDPDAGADQTICAMNTTLNANIITTGTGTWIPVNVLSSVTNSLANSTSATLPNQGVFGFVWQTSNSAFCPMKNDTVYIRTYSNPSAANAGLDITSSCLMNSLVAITPSVGVGTWSIISGSGSFDNINSPNAQYLSDADGKVKLVWTVSNGNCPSTTDTMDLYIDPLLIPQIITPNGDGSNDVFDIKLISCLSGVKISIFNRWGNLVYDSNDYKNDFKGYNNSGQPLADDTYFYILELPKKTYKGYVVVKTQ